MSDTNGFKLEAKHKLDLREITSFLNEAGVNFVRPGPFHIKIGPINYYIGRGRIVIDGEQSRQVGTGLDALKAVFLERGLLRSPSSNNVKPFPPQR